MEQSTPEILNLSLLVCYTIIKSMHDTRSKLAVSQHTNQQHCDFKQSWKDLWYSDITIGSIHQGIWIHLSERERQTFVKGG